MLIGEMYGKPADPRDVAAGTYLRDTLFGIEVELENCLPLEGGARARYWTIKADGSLRSTMNGRMSMELVFAVPLGGKDAENAIDELDYLMGKLDPYSSDRCGTHVHVDVRDLEERQYYLFVAAAMLVEPVLVHLFSPERSENCFCLPRYKLVEDNKYRGINVDATENYGSVEFRIFRRIEKDNVGYLKKLMTTLQRLRLIAPYIDESDLTPDNIPKLLGIREEDIPQAAKTHIHSAHYCALSYLMGHRRLREPRNNARARGGRVPEPVVFIDRLDFNAMQEQIRDMNVHRNQQGDRQ